MPRDILPTYGSGDQRSIRQAPDTSKRLSRRRGRHRRGPTTINDPNSTGLAGRVEEMHDGFASIREELRDIRQRLEALEEAARNSAGLTKEIDHLMERVRAIEKRLGIETKIAA